MLKEMTWDEVEFEELRLAGGDTPDMQAYLDLLRDKLQGEGVIALVKFVNEAFDSSAFGAASWVTVGPSCTYKTVAECDGRWLNDLPSQRQYARAFVMRVSDTPARGLDYEPGGDGPAIVDDAGEKRDA